MADWEDEDFEPAEIDKPTIPKTDLWAGEDEDEDVKDNWDDEEETKPAAGEPAPPKPEQQKTNKKKALAKKLKEIEEMEARAKEERLNAAKETTPEGRLKDKLMAQKLSEESDFDIARDTFSADVTDSNKTTIDNFKGTTKEHFEQFEDMLSSKITSFQSSPHYHFLLETLFRNCCLTLEAETIKKLASSLSVLQSEKAKQERQKKGGKKTTKAKLVGSSKGATNDDIVDYSTYNDFEDFI